MSTEQDQRQDLPAWQVDATREMREITARLRDEFPDLRLCPVGLTGGTFFTTCNIPPRYPIIEGDSLGELEQAVARFAGKEAS
ncbi:hypothetical protein HNR46_001617 [Haloferula luteola]|uniref:Uncharacterized protein n=1 Tax=Haloferula luteola TaxID=595692 RepID=A0A840VEY7_9BACT|nr:hypothetical protein [Haloferula luteola]